MAKKILVVEDERQLAHVMEINLRKAGYDIVCTYDGVEGMEKARSERPDMIIIDQHLPRLSGWDLAEALQKEPATQGVPLYHVPR